MLLFPFCFRLSSVCYLHGTGRFCINGEPPRFLTSSHFVCTVCIFSKAFEADHKSMGLPVKETGLVYLLATRHPCNCRVVLSCTCITEAPNKTHCGRLVRNRRAPSGFCVLSFSRRDAERGPAFMSVTHTRTHKEQIIKPHSHIKFLSHICLCWVEFTLTPATSCSFYCHYHEVWCFYLSICLQNIIKKTLELGGGS